MGIDVPIIELIDGVEQLCRQLARLRRGKPINGCSQYIILRRGPPDAAVDYSVIGVYPQIRRAGSGGGKCLHQLEMVPSPSCG
ncbi:hypothetical protein BST36_30100 [Mycolicibacterium moriokaense]|nr:hypothetical protein BST36_30100 [Mycolicibacterium moriokaense]